MESNKDIKKEMVKKIIKPPVITKYQNLPFEKLSWDNFEKICLKLGTEYLGSSPYKYGRQGQKQNGIDLYFNVDGKVILWQCKCYKNFKLNDLKRAAEEFLENKNQFDACEFVLCVSNCKDDVNIVNAIDSIKKEFRQRDLTFDLYDSTKLTGIAIKHLEIIESFFGYQWRSLYECDDASIKMNIAFFSVPLININQDSYLKITEIDDQTDYLMDNFCGNSLNFIQDSLNCIENLLDEERAYKLTLEIENCGNIPINEIEIYDFNFYLPTGEVDFDGYYMLTISEYDEKERRMLKNTINPYKKIRLNILFDENQERFFEFDGDIYISFRAIVKSKYSQYINKYYISIYASREEYIDSENKIAGIYLPREIQIYDNIENIDKMTKE